MVRTLKTRRQKKYRYDTNRKNLKKKLKSTGKIKWYEHFNVWNIFDIFICLLFCSAEIKKSMDHRQTLTSNISEMGLVFDVNKSLGLPNHKSDRLKMMKIVNGFLEEDQSESDAEQEKSFPKHHVVDELEKNSKELRESKFRLPKGQIKLISYYIDKFGLDYKKMAKDVKNYDQETWRQLRAKCRKFMSIPEHFSKYLEERDLVDCETNPNDPRWQETNTDIEDDWNN